MGALSPSPVADRLIVDELRCRTRWRGSSAQVAIDIGISRSHLLGLINGNARMTDTSRQLILDRIREEDLRLADKIEAELQRPLYKQGVDW
jgi:hypothetical protein